MATGKSIVNLALKHVGERYVLGAVVPKDNPKWTGPWDCAEFASWCLFQVSGKLYGCDRDDGPPARADAYSGYWMRDAENLGSQISVSQAAVMPGAIVIRAPQPNQVGHVVISDGAGGTVEAHSSKRGVITSTLDGRRWDTAVLVPWIDYVRQAAPTVSVERPALVLRLKDPLMTGALVKSVQRALRELGFHPGPIDGGYGDQTIAAVTAFQIRRGLVPDGECGAVTARALGIAWA